MTLTKRVIPCLDVAKVKEANPFGVILGKALYENKISIEEAKKL